MKKEMTALVRYNGNLKVIRDDYFTRQSDFASELRANGYKVLKIWNGNRSTAFCFNWEILNRK